jgi:Zn-dependent protease/predicted transcriptional regulator
MFGRPVKLFSILGFEIRANVSWLLLVALVTWSLATGLFPEFYKGLTPSSYWWMGGAGALGLFLSIIFHELSHSIVARKSGLNMKGITLFIFGGVAEMEGDPIDPKTEFKMAIAGPLSSALLSVVTYVVYVWGNHAGWPVEVTGILSYLAWINIALAAFNLVPAFPLDGGRVLRSALWSWKKDLRWATGTAAQIGSGFGILLIVMGVIYLFRGNFIGGMWWAMIGLFLRSTAQMSYQQLLARTIFHARKNRDLMVKDPVTVSRSITIEEFVQNYVYKYHFSMYPVLSFGRLAGCISIKQAAAVPREEWSEHTVGEIASQCDGETIVGPEDNADKALDIMNRTGSSRLLVVEGDQLVGMIVLKDMLKLLSLKMALNDAEQK